MYCFFSFRKLSTFWRKNKFFLSTDFHGLIRIFLTHSHRAFKDANIKLYNKFKKRLKKPFYKTLIFNVLKLVI